MTVFCNFSDLAAITVSGQHNRNKSRVWWTYQILALDKRGRVFALSDNEKSEDRHSLIASAAKIADITGARFFDMPGEKIARVRHVYGNFEFDAVEHRAIDSFIDFFKTFVAVIVFLLTTTALILIFRRPSNGLVCKPPSVSKALLKSLEKSCHVQAVDKAVVHLNCNRQQQLAFIFVSSAKGYSWHRIA